MAPCLEGKTGDKAQDVEVCTRRQARGFRSPSAFLLFNR